ncbi:MAG: hypothetical protein GY874_07530 [Desulfobacteraceae bacterium]|nr:hypothetical protein [Desulfobacteraceae bacterium]
MKLSILVLVFVFLAATFALAGEETISGIVAQTDQAIVISADNGETYLIAGQDLSALAGKTVKATGTLEEGEAGKILKIISVEEVRE